MYSDSLLSGLQQVTTQSQTARKLLEEMLEIFEERALLEERYAKQLEKMVGNLSKLEERNAMFKLPIYCLKSIYASRQHQAEGFFQSLREDLIVNLKGLVQGQNQQSKKLLEDAKKLEKDYTNLSIDVKKNFFDFKQKRREYEQNATVMVIYNLLSEFSEKKRIKQYYKVNEIQKQLLEYESKYKQSLQEINLNADLQKEKMKQIMNDLQTQEEARITIFKDTLFRQIIFEVSHAKNIQYDLEKITEKLEEIQPPQEIKKFIDSYQKPQEQLFEKQELVQINSYISNSLQRFFNKEFDDQLQQIDDQKISEIARNTMDKEDFELADDNPQILKIYEQAITIKKIWNGAQFNDEELQYMKQKFIDDTQARNNFLMCLQLKRSQQQFELTPDAFTSLAKVMRILLDVSNQYYDATTAKKIMNLSFNFYKLKDEDVRDKIYSIQNELVNHKIWETRDYWETCIIQQIYEQIKDQQNKSKSQKYNYHLKSFIEQIIKEKNLILTILTQISQNMLLFNFKFEPLKDIMIKFSAFFDLNEEISQDLQNAIDGFEKARQQQLLLIDQQKQKQEQEQVQQDPPQQVQQAVPQQNQQQNSTVMNKISSFFNK